MEPNDPLEQIDISRFEELADGDPGGLVELVQLYLAKTTEQVDELDRALHKQSCIDAARIAHSLVGANAMVGMTALVPTLREIEASAEKNDVARARTAFERARKQFQTIRDALRRATSRPA